MTKTYRIQSYDPNIVDFEVEARAMAYDIHVVNRAKDGRSHVRVYRDNKGSLDRLRAILHRDYVIRRGDYHGTTHNRSDRWYAVWLDGVLLRGLDTVGTATKAEAIEWTVREWREIADL